LLIGFVGVLLLVNPGSIASPTMNPVAPIITVIAAGCWAFGSLYARRAPLPANGTLSTGMQLLAGGAMILILSLVTGDAATLNVSAISPTSLIAMIHLTIMSSVITFSAFVWLMKHVNPAKVATYSYVNPVIAMILGFVLAGEPITAPKVAAAAIILAGVVLITAYGSRRVTFRNWRLVAAGEAV
jgi:drug/metabolite transporter (DMT)-like permease